MNSSFSAQDQQVLVSYNCRRCPASCSLMGWMQTLVHVAMLIMVATNAASNKHQVRYEVLVKYRCTSGAAWCRWQHNAVNTQARLRRQCHQDVNMPVIVNMPSQPAQQSRQLASNTHSLPPVLICGTCASVFVCKDDSTQQVFSLAC